MQEAGDTHLIGKPFQAPEINDNHTLWKIS